MTVSAAVRQRPSPQARVVSSRMRRSWWAEGEGEPVAVDEKLEERDGRRPERVIMPALAVEAAVLLVVVLVLALVAVLGAVVAAV